VSLTLPGHGDRAGSSGVHGREKYRRRLRVDEGGKLLGVFSERDVLNRVVVAKRDPTS
jgi:CBS domain-containing protein